MNEKARDLVSQPLPVFAYPNQDDEINLVDVWLSVSQYRNVFWGVFAIIVLLGASYTAFIFKEKFSLVTTIQMGTVESENQTKPIESPDSLISKINNSIAPKYTRQWLQDNNLQNLFETEISNPKGSDIVLLTNKVKENELSLFTSYQQGLANIIIDDHRRLIDSLKAGLISELEIAQLKMQELKNPITLGIQLKSKEISLDTEINKLNKLKDENFFGIKKNEFQNRISAGQHELDLVKKGATVLQDQLKRMQETKQILSRNIGELKLQIEDARKNKKAAQAGATELSAMSQLLIDNEIQQNNNRLLALEERYYVTLENEKSELIKQMEANRFQQIDLERQNNVLKQKYEELLLDNQIQIEQQGLVIDKSKLEIERVKQAHEKLLSEQIGHIKEIETRLDNYNETRVVSDPVPSMQPAGLKRNVLMVLIFVLAIMGGFFMVLLALFSDKVRQRKQELIELNE